MHFKNEASPAVNPYTAVRRCYWAVSCAAGCPVSLCPLGPSHLMGTRLPVAHANIPACPSGSQSCSQGTNAILTPSCALIPFATRLLPPPEQSDKSTTGCSCLSPSPYIVGDAATKMPHDPGARGPINSSRREAFRSRMSSSWGNGPKPSPGTRQGWGEGPLCATASSMQCCISGENQSCLAKGL